MFFENVKNLSLQINSKSIFYYIFSCDNTEEMTLCYNVK